MKKSLLTLMLLACVIIANAANVGATKTKVGPRPSKLAPVAINHNTIRKAPRKADVGQTIDLYFTSEDISYKWYEGEDASFWYFGCFDDSGEYLVRLAYNTEEQCTTVNYSDLNNDYSYLTYSGDEEYTELTFLEGTTFTVSEEEGCVVITGNLLCDDGNTYVLHVNCPLPQPETYDIEGEKITMAEYTEDWNEWDVRFKNDEWKINLALLSEDGSFAGTYTLDDAADACYATNLYEDEDYAFTEMTVTTTLPEGVTDPTEGCEITGTAKDAMGNTFNFHMKKNPPIQPKEVKNIEVNVETAEWPSENTGGSYYELTEKANPQHKWILSLYDKTGEATQSEGIDTTATYRTTLDTEEELHMNNGTITQTFDSENLTIAVEASLVMNDSVQYNFSFTTPVSKDGEETITFTDLLVDSSLAEWGPTELSASTDNVALSAELQDYATIGDDLSDDNFAIGLDIWENGESTYVGKNALIYAKTEWAEDGTPVLHAKFLGDNRIIYTIEATYVKPEITDTLRLTREDVEFADYTEYGDGFYFNCQRDDDEYQMYVNIKADQVVGHFTMDEVTNNSFVAYLTESGMPKYLYFSEADFNVTRDGATYTLDGTCKAGKYFVYLTMTYTISGLDYDSTDSDVDVTFTQDDLVEITPVEDEYAQYYYVKLLNKQRNDELVLAVFPEEFDGSTSIPAGEYEITSWGWGNYVQAGQTDGETGIYPSYYAQLDANGYVKAPLWFLYSGNMTVTADEANTAFEINAKNSYGRIVHAIFAIPTAINSASVNNDETAVQKSMRNGEIIIRKGDAEYNAVGQRRK